MSHGRIATRLGIGMILAAVGCRKEAPPPPAAPPAPNTVVINASNYQFTAPDTIPSGWTRLRINNAGPAIHHAQILRLDSGRTFDSLSAMLRRPPNGPPPMWMVEMGGPNPPAPGENAEVITNLAPGHYAIICFIPDSVGAPHFTHGMIRPLEVKAATGTAAAEPTADVNIALADYMFTESAPITAGAHVIQVTNGGQQPHEMFIARLDSGVTPQQVVDWIDHGMHGRPPAHPLGGVAAMGVGTHSYVVANFTPGNYGLFCFVPDKKDGKDHTKHGMVKQITVS
jgi:hypothetical protein